jgi:SAM-dependent methyltransferase
MSLSTAYRKAYGLAKRLRYASRVASAYLFKATSEGERFRCPLCGYFGPFRTKNADTGSRQHAQCPRCGSLERHRLQFLVLQTLSTRFDFSKLRILHVAPEMFIQKHLKKMFGSYVSTDLCQRGVDFHADLRSLPIESGSYDIVYASHVLEHIDRDRDAIAEIRRVLAPGGFAILPVPIVGLRTIEYSEPNPFEVMHFRAPGPDYFEKYREHFQEVECFKSNDFPSDFQLYVYEDRSNWPTERMPLRQPTMGEKHIDIVPVCFV